MLVFSRYRHFHCIEGLCGRLVRSPARPSVFRVNLKTNGALYAFMAAIIAGMPMIFITRVML